MSSCSAVRKGVIGFRGCGVSAMADSNMTTLLEAVESCDGQVKVSSNMVMVVVDKMSKRKAKEQEKEREREREKTLMQNACAPCTQCIGFYRMVAPASWALVTRGRLGCYDT